MGDTRKQGGTQQAKTRHENAKAVPGVCLDPGEHAIFDKKRGVVIIEWLKQTDVVGKLK